jgi:hypothetical protein
MQTPAPDIVYVPGIDLLYYFKIIGNFFSGNSGEVVFSLQNFIGVVNAVCIVLSVFLLIAIVITVEGIKRIRNIEDERYNQPPKQEAAPTTENVIEKEMAARWRKVVEHVDSPNPNDWKQAIIEADIMLDQLVTKLGYRGDSLGEKLKRTVRGDFKTRDMAWEAHLVRNRIAHDGSTFDLNQLEAKRVISLYRQVFEEFYHIS